MSKILSITIMERCFLRVSDLPVFSGTIQQIKAQKGTTAKYAVKREISNGIISGTYISSLTSSQ